MPRMQAFCKDVQHGHAKVIRCLEDNLEQPTFNATCKAEIQKHAANSATDYRWAAGAQCTVLCLSCPLGCIVLLGDSQSTPVLLDLLPHFGCRT